MHYVTTDGGSGNTVESGWVKDLRTQLGLTQSELAERLGVTFVTISRWENGQARPNKLARKALTALAVETPAARGHGLTLEAAAPYEAQKGPPLVDFRSDAETVRLFVEGERLRYGHLFSPSFATETALIDPLPHQLVAVYRRMLPQPRLRFLLADDAGAGKTIMAGLYIREMLARGLVRRVLVIPPAGLVGNWLDEMRELFSLHMREVTGPDCRDENPFSGPGSDLVVASIDTISGGRAFERLAEASTEPYDLAIFDEAHKLAARRNPDFTYDTTERYKLAELLAGAEPLQDTRPPRRLSWQARHLLLMTATPHMGKDFPFYALWRLLEPSLFRTEDAFNDFPRAERERYYLRRTKEEMLRLNGTRIYPPRHSQTPSYELSPDEQELYDATTAYVSTYYNKAAMLNRSAARLAMSILQRRAASSTWALLRSLQRRRGRLDEYIARLLTGQLTEAELLQQQMRLPSFDPEDDRTSDEESASDGREQREVDEDEAMAVTTARDLAQLQVERERVQDLVEQAQQVYDRGSDAKLVKLCELIEDTQFRDEKLLIFTEHRDTMDYLVRSLEARGYTGQVARIHGGMPRKDRQKQMAEFRGRCRFMVATDAAGEGINLQFCWIMVNYDIPWNPARIEQRFGRIHRYKQEHDTVVLVNLIAARTREGRVLKTLLEKLETIRKELRSDKVFDIIGRQLQGLSLSEIIMSAVTGDSADEAAGRIGELASARRATEALQADQDRLPTSGDVAVLLPSLRIERERERLAHLLPGYVRNFVQKSAAHLGIRIVGDIESRFRLEGLPLALSPALDQSDEPAPELMSVTRPRPEEQVRFLRPGEPFFDHYLAHFCETVAGAARRGGAFIDPYATEPYLYHLALVTAIRRADAAVPAGPSAEQLLELRLVGLSQTLGGEPRLCPVDLLMVLRPLSHPPPAALPPQARIVEAMQRAQAYLQQAVAAPMAGERRRQVLTSLEGREQLLKRGFDYQAAELAGARTKLGVQAQLGMQFARRSLEEVRRRQQKLEGRKAALLATMRREPELIEPGQVAFLAHALVLPSSDPEEMKRHDREIERIAVSVARSYELAAGAEVEDVSTPALALKAGLSPSPGFDLLSRRPHGERLCIEVKGRRGIGDVELTANEWPRAANLGQEYWLYVVYDCVAAQPRLVRVQDPFRKLIVKARGGVIIDEKSVFEAAEGG